jgi:hypothetical protein
MGVVAACTSSSKRSRPSSSVNCSSSVDPPTPSIVCRCPQGSQGDRLAQSGRADRSLDPEGSTDRFDIRALKRRFLKRCNKRCNAFWAFVTV